MAAARKNKDVYGEPTILIVGDNIARIYTPILTDEERERRLAAIRKASVQMVLSRKPDKK